MTKSILAGIVMIAAGTLTAPVASAQSAADLYKDRTVTILVGYGAGGTYGQTSLLLSRHLSNHIPGNPTVILTSRPGGGGIKSATYA